MGQRPAIVPGLNEGFGHKWVIGRSGLALLLLAFEFVWIAALAVVTGVAYHAVAYDGGGDAVHFAAIGVLAALLYTLPTVYSHEYRLEDFLEGRRGPARAFLRWTYVFLFLAVIGFLTKTTSIFSRGWLVAFYVLGLLTMVALDVAVARVNSMAIARGRIALRRVMLVGVADEVDRMAQAVESPRAGFRVVARVVLPPTFGRGAPETFTPELNAAVDRARALGIDDIIILTDWSRGAMIHEMAEAFSVLPTAVHLGASSVIGPVSRARLARFGDASALSLTVPPLTPLQSLTKRTFDVVAASAALVLLSPLLLVLAVLIKLDSAGPVFFRQRRRGYNLKEFRIWKLRTMTTLDDGPVITQAARGDARVTRIGRFLRRTNLDELPQLINVVAGEMSLVGPRPHAVAHDELFETRIAKYRRRLNVRPGITGWAQVNGLRGPTETDCRMRARVEHDLYYIDHWSVWLDLYILAATVLSHKAFRNAL